MMDLNNLEENIACSKKENEKLKKECAELTREGKKVLENIKRLRETKLFKFSIIRDLKKQLFLENISVCEKKREQENVLYRYYNMASICYSVSSTVINMKLKIDVEKLKYLKSELQILKEKFYHFILDKHHELEKNEVIEAYTLLLIENKYLTERLYVLHDALKQKKTEISFLESEKLRCLQKLFDKCYKVQNMNLNPHSSISVFKLPSIDNLRKETSQMISANNVSKESINDPLNLIFFGTSNKTDESSHSTNSLLNNFDSERSCNYSLCNRVNKNIGIGDVHTTNTFEDIEYECNETESEKKCNFSDLYESIHYSEVMSPPLLDYCKLIDYLYNSPCKSVIVKNKSSFTSCCKPVPKQHIFSSYSAIEFKRKNSRYSSLHYSSNKNLHYGTNDSKIDISTCCMSKSNRYTGGRNTTLFTNCSPSVSASSQSYCCNPCRHTESHTGGGDDDFCVNLTKEK